MVSRRKPALRQDDKSETEQSGVQSIETGMRILAAFIGLGSEPMMKSLAERAGMHPAKVHRYLVSFTRTGFVEQNSVTGRYRLGPMALRLGSAALQNIDIVRTVSPVMPGICEEIGETVVLAIWVQYGPVIVRVEEVPGPTTVTTQVGALMPLLSSATGRLFSAFLPRDIVRPMLEREFRINRQSLRSVAGSMQEVDAMMDEVRERGLARVTGDMGPGINALSAPIFNHAGAIVAALSSLGPAGRFDNDWNGELAQKLRRAARGLSRMAGYDGTKDPVKAKSAGALASARKSSIKKKIKRTKRS
jgi:DNA-binding IclR family transcriptional regulator